MGPLYALTPRTAAGLTGLLDDGGAIAPRKITARPIVAGVTWVEAFGTPSDDWWPGRICLDDRGTLKQNPYHPVEAIVCELMNHGGIADGGDIGFGITNGSVYPCVPTGSNPSTGVPRFRTITPGFLSARTVIPTFNLTTSTSNTPEAVPDGGGHVDIKIPCRGLYLVWANVYGAVSGASGFVAVLVYQSLADSGGSFTAVANTSTPVAISNATDQLLHSGFLLRPYAPLSGYGPEKFPITLRLYTYWTGPGARPATCQINGGIGGDPSGNFGAVKL